MHYNIYPGNCVGAEVVDPTAEGGSADLDNDLPLMQYTGLKDKNGEEIYEGDIVRFHSNGSNTYVREVLWVNPITQNSFAGFVILNLACTDGFPSILQKSITDFCEVIGNIYENPELLEEK